MLQSDPDGFAFLGQIFLYMRYYTVQLGTTVITNSSFYSKRFIYQNKMFHIHLILFLFNMFLFRCFLLTIPDYAWSLDPYIKNAQKNKNFHLKYPPTQYKLPLCHICFLI